MKRQWMQQVDNSTLKNFTWEQTTARLNKIQNILSNRWIKQSYVTALDYLHLAVPIFKQFQTARKDFNLTIK